MVCSVCGQRKAKRACPGVRDDICTVCCGTKRLVTIACPPTCVYLEAAQRHPAAVVKRQHDADLEVLAQALGPLSETQLELFFLLQTVISRFNPEGFGRLLDADVATAVGALAATLETASRGIVYEHQAASPAGEGLRRELKTVLEKLGRGSQLEREVAVVLRGIERGAKHDTPGIGSGPTDYLTLAARVLQERPPERSSPSPLILP
jgi:hypothetical protein